MVPFQRFTRRALWGSSRLVLLAAIAMAGLLAAAAWWIMRVAPAPASLPTAARGEATPASSPRDQLVDAERGPSSQATAGSLAIANQGAVGVRLTGEGVLVGTVSLRETGALVADARVELFAMPPAGAAAIGRVLELVHMDEQAMTCEPVASALSGGDGTFEMRGVRPGGYFVQARGEWCVSESTTFAQVSPGPSQPIQVWVRQGGRVLGQVLRPDGTPAAGAGVSLRPGLEDVLDKLRSGDVTFLEARADEDGRFTITGVPPGRGWAIAAWGASATLSHAVDVSVSAGIDTQVELVLRRGATVEGRLVVGPGPRQEGAPEAGFPVSGAHVGVVPHGLRDLLFIDHLMDSCHTTTGSNGQFSLDRVPPGGVEVVAFAPRFLPTVGSEAFVEEGARVTVGDVPLGCGPFVSGRVVDGQGRAVAGASVTWEPIDVSGLGMSFSLAPFLPQAIDGFLFPRTDSDGRFTAGAFPGEPPYRISISKAGYADAGHDWSPSYEGGEIEIVMSPGGAIEGIVMDRERRQPVTLFQVTSSDQLPDVTGVANGEVLAAGGTVVSDAGGRFRLAPVEAGNARLRVRAPGYAPQSVDSIKVEAGETTRGVIVMLDPACKVRGRVVDEQGRGIAGAIVFCGSSSDSDSSSGINPSEYPGFIREFAAGLGVFASVSTASANDGTFEISDVGAGAHVVHAVHREYASGMSASVEVAANAVATGVEIVLERGATLHGTVSDRFGQPVPGVFVVAFSPGALGRGDGTRPGGGVYQGRSDAEGRYEITRMAGGGYFLSTTRGNAALDPTSLLGSLNFELVTVPAGAEVRYDVVDNSIGGTRVFGAVTEHGRLVSGGNLMAFGYDSESILGVDVKFAHVRADGSYQFDSLAPGEYRFQVTTRRGSDGERGRESSVAVDVPDVPEVRIDISLPEGGIEGVVRDLNTHEPIDGAMVSLKNPDAPVAGGLLGRMMPQGGGRRIFTDEGGKFEFEGLEPGRYLVEAGPPRWGDLQERYSAIEPVETKLGFNERVGGLELLLKPALLLKGLVHDESGNAVSGAQIVAVRTDVPSNSSPRTTSDERGRYTMGGLTQGTWTLRVSSPEFAATNKSGVVIDSDAPAELDLVVQRGVQVSVRVVDAAGRPLSGATAQLLRMDSNESLGSDAAQEFFGLYLSGQGSTDAEGRMNLGRFANGRYRLEVQRGSSRAPTQQVDIDGGEAIELKARVP